MKQAHIRATVRRDAEGEYIQHDTRRFRIAWGIDKIQCPAPGAHVLINRSPDWPRYRRRIMLFRYPDGEQWLGHADASTD